MHSKVINNIYIALPRLITAAKARYLWIDGLCINQENDEEKAIQVPLMKDVYSLCCECLVWLGESTPGVEVVIDTFPRFGRNQDLDDISRSIKAWAMEGTKVLNQGITEFVLWEGFVDLFIQPWFQRVWTFQEAVLPPKVIFLTGSRRLAFRKVATLAIALLEPVTSLDRYMHTVLSKDRVLEAFSPLGL